MTLNIYHGGLRAILRKFEAKQRPILSPLDYLPPTDCILDDMRERLVTQKTGRPTSRAPDELDRVYREIHAEFLGRSELLFVHAMLIAISRRRPLPAEIAPFFLRLWTEQGDWLAQNLDTRWKISAATSFAELGQTQAQRAVGMGLSVLFDTIKLYESERSINGKAGTQLGRRLPIAKRGPLPLGLRPYVIARGDLDRNMLARLLSLAQQDAAIHPLAQSMLMQIMTDTGTVFARMQSRKGILPEQDDGLT